MPLDYLGWDRTSKFKLAHHPLRNLTDFLDRYIDRAADDGVLAMGWGSGSAYTLSLKSISNMHNIIQDL